MRILMITDVYFPRVNGVSTSIKTFINELENKGCHVTLIAPMYGIYDDDDEDQDSDVKIIRVPSRKVPFDPEDRLMKNDLLIYI